MQINCHNVSTVSNAELEAIVANNELSIVCMQEPNFQVKKTERLTGLGDLNHFHAKNDAKK